MRETPTLLKDIRRRRHLPHGAVRDYCPLPAGHPAYLRAPCLGHYTTCNGCSQSPSLWSDIGEEDDSGKAYAWAPKCL